VATTATASTDPAPLSGIKESLLDRSATNANQGWFDACASMKDDRQYSERDKISSEKQKWKLKNGTKILAIAVDQSIIDQQTNQRINLKAISDFVG